MIKNPIWFDDSPFEYASSRWKNCVIDHLGIEMLEAGADFLKARMPVDQRTRQPAGILHGGASVVLAETLASCAAAFTLDRSRQHCVGLSINANHVRSVKDGYVEGIASALHIGRTTQIWQVMIRDQRDRLVCVSRVTMAVLDNSATPHNTEKYPR
ncbi:MAG: hotdog fold thioesterase [Desulfocapsaceae bacterium]|nr:hotdog fold thioesterase [Desulfocapsaceae bacterium]